MCIPNVENAHFPRYNRRMNVIFGISASGGIGIGQSFVLPEQQKRSIPQKKITSSEVPAEWQRFIDACSNVQNSINSQLQSLNKDNLQRIIFETYLLMLTDPVFLDEVNKELESRLQNIEEILTAKVQEYAHRLRDSGNDYLAERAQDIESVFGKVIDNLIDFHPFNIDEIPENSVIVAKNMSPTDAVVFGKKSIAGLALTEGGISSHITILAKSYGIPAVVGLEGISEQISTGQTIIVDGELGEVLTNPDENTIKDYNRKIDAERIRLQTLEKYKNLPAQTKDGTQFKIFANIGTVEEAKIAAEQGADGIGLFRTEFLFMNTAQKFEDETGKVTNSITEETQFQAYKQVLQIMGDKPVTIRTLDAGGDKLVNSKDIPIFNEKNPLMGLRAIRLSLFYPQILRTQLRALYRASVYGNLKIMLPLVTDVSQVDTIRGIARGVQLSLKEDNIPFREDVPFGIMIETAAAAITSDCLAPHADFFSVGTNDLTQYTLGIDRENPQVAPLYNEYHLAVLRLIQQTIDSADRAHIPLSVCGEMAGRKESSIILAGMGVRNLSVSSRQIPAIKETLSQFTIDELKTISNRSLF